MEGKIIDLLTKLKYRKVKDNVLMTTNKTFTIFIYYENISKLTEVTVYENIPGVLNQYDCNQVFYQCIDGNLLSEFTVISNEDYLINRLEVEI